MSALFIRRPKSNKAGVDYFKHVYTINTREKVPLEFLLREFKALEVPDTQDERINVLWIKKKDLVLTWGTPDDKEFHWFVHGKVSKDKSPQDVSWDKYWFLTDERTIKLMLLEVLGW